MPDQITRLTAEQLDYWSDLVASMVVNREMEPVAAMKYADQIVAEYAKREPLPEGAGHAIANELWKERCLDELAQCNSHLQDTIESRNGWAAIAKRDDARAVAAENSLKAANARIDELSKQADAWFRNHEIIRQQNVELLADSQNNERLVAALPTLRKVLADSIVLRCTRDRLPIDVVYEWSSRQIGLSPTFDELRAAIAAIDPKFKTEVKQ
jgi:hypothetical protein